MTKREAAIVSAYTGILIGDFSEVHRYIEEILDRPVFTHELPGLFETIKEKAIDDFLAIEVTE